MSAPNARRTLCEILKGILNKAKAGGRELQAIRGYTIERELGRAAWVWFGWLEMTLPASWWP